MAAAWFTLGRLRLERAPWWAAQWLTEGHDGPAMLALACLDGTDHGEIRDLLPRALAEMNTTTPTVFDAAVLVFDDMARRHLAGERDERWVIRRVDEVLLSTDYPATIIDLPLGELYSYADYWDEPWGPSEDERRHIVHDRCTRQLQRPPD